MMHNAVTFFLILSTTVFSCSGAPLNAQQPPASVIELQSGPLTPGMVLEECPRPVHQFRILIGAQLKRATLILDSNTPKFDDFGRLVGGVVSPSVRGPRGAREEMRLQCVIELVNKGHEKWRLFRISGPQLRTPLRIATRGSLGDGGPARLLVLDSDQQVKAVVACTRYGLVVP